MRKLKELYTKTLDKVIKAKEKAKGHHFEKRPAQHTDISSEINNIFEPAPENVEMSSIRKSSTTSKASSKASIRGQKSEDDSAASRDYLSLYSEDGPKDSIERLTKVLNDSDLGKRVVGECREAKANPNDLGEDFDESDTEGPAVADFEDFVEGVSRSRRDEFRDDNESNGYGTIAFGLGNNAEMYSQQDSRTSSELQRPREDIQPLLTSTEELDFENDEDEYYEGDGMFDYNSQSDGQYQRKMRRFARNPNATASELSDSADSDFEDEAEDTDQGYMPLSSPDRSDLQELLHQEEYGQISVDDAEEEKPENSRSSSLEFILNDSTSPTLWPSATQRTSAAQHPFLSNSISAPRGLGTNANRIILQPRHRLPHYPSKSRPDLFENHSSSPSYFEVTAGRLSSSPSNELKEDYNYSYAKDTRPRLRHMLLCDNCEKMGHRWMHCLEACALCGNSGHGIYACGKGKKRVNEDELDLDDEEADVDTEMEMRRGEVGFKRIKWGPETEERQGKLVIYE